MPGRILNFSEFFGKYSKDSGTGEKNLDSFTQASSNFEAGFDDDTYEKTPLGPNKPVASGSEMTPAAPGETGAPAFSSQSDSDMSAPEDTQEDTEEQQTVDVPEPEAGANPEEDDDEDTEEESTDEKESNESTRVKGFNQFINEMYNLEYLSDDDWEKSTCPNCGGHLEGMGLHKHCPECESHEESEYESCASCNEPYDEYGATCGCNM